MSRGSPERVSGLVRFPRVSGDEPLSAVAPCVEAEFSPRERG